MPREIDVTARLSSIAQATLAVAREGGAPAITIRSVAAALGGSTTLVTNYLPSRTALILNALDYGRTRWADELDDALATLAPKDRLPFVIAWALTGDDEDPVLRTLALEATANPSSDPEIATWLRNESETFLGLLIHAAAEHGVRDPEATGRAAALLLSGGYVALNENPERWTEEGVLETVCSTLGITPYSGPLDVLGAGHVTTA